MEKDMKMPGTTPYKEALDRIWDALPAVPEIVDAEDMVKLSQLDDDYETIRTALNAQGWREDMENAPKDREILAADSEGVRSVIRWGKHNHVPLYGWLRWERYGEEDVESFEPSYWRELNAAPAGSQGEE